MSVGHASHGRFPYDRIVSYIREYPALASPIGFPAGVNREDKG